MPDWAIPILQTVLGACAIGVLYAVPKIWADTRQNTRDIETHEKQFQTLFSKIDDMSDNVSWIRGKLDE